MPAALLYTGLAQQESKCQSSLTPWPHEQPHSTGPSLELCNVTPSSSHESEPLCPHCVPATA